MRFGPVKMPEQQSVMMLHRVRFTLNRSTWLAAFAKRPDKQEKSM
jgi:hypothetical protein